MRPGGEKRGSSYDRRRRKVWLLANFDKDLGPARARCWLDLSDKCLQEVDATTITADRINPGGSYARGNIQPACAPCQNLQGALITAWRRLQWRLAMEEARARGIEWDGQIA